MKKHEYKIKPDNPQEVGCIIEKKILFFRDVIQRTFINSQNNQYKDILTIVDVTTCNERLTELNASLHSLNSDDQNNDSVVNKLQLINNDLSSILKNYGTMNLEDLLLICFGNNLLESDHSKFDLLKKYFHPISYKIVTKNEEFKQKKQSDEVYDETSIKHLDCFDIITTYKQFHVKVYGMKLYVHSAALNKSLFIFGIIDDVAVDFLGNSYIETKKNQVYSIINPELKGETFDRFLSSLNLKDYLTIGSSHIINKYNDYINRANTIHQKQISVVIKDFITEDLYKKRTTLIQLLIMPSRIDNQYLSYMLYDLLSNDVNGVVDSKEQTMLYESFTHKTKIFFKQAMKKTLSYTNSLYNFDINKIPLEQQICLMNAPDSVKEKGMMKLKEVKNKSEDSGAKARQYLDGLLKIPFGVFRREPILDVMSVIKKQFRDYCECEKIFDKFPAIPNKSSYTSMEIYKYVKDIQSSNMVSNEPLQHLHEKILQGDKQSLIDNINIMNEILISNNLEDNKIKLGTNKSNLKAGINSFFKLCKSNQDIKDNLLTLLLPDKKSIGNEGQTINIGSIQKNIDRIVDYTKFIRKTLDSSVHGHDKPKKQLEMIMAEWMSSGDKGNGYVIGFEGNPGVGKTSLAKGIANCLVSEDGKTRPFKILMMGGDANAASLVGHSFTYVGSNWGLIVQYLQDSGCMNPVIVIDEPDKISKTEHGKEITGILTHLLDKTQNHLFQDKYFAGVDLDLSKVLFILCYNDPNSIDSVLLDRIHRVKFDSLTTDDKIVIVKKHLLPEILKNIGLENMITFSDETIKIIVNDYTQEPGVRKLKEKMFEIVGAINLNILQNPLNDIQLPLEVTIDDVKKLYFKDKREVVPFKIHTESKVGLINALWANDLSQGGVLPLQVSFIPAAEFLSLTLTGSLGDVMKESIRVSLTNAWNLTSKSRQQYLIDTYNNPKTNSVCGLHLHCPSISTKKDGPSATTAFTILIYSLFNDIKIKNTFGITGETSFDYILSEIGGLEFKIIHSIPSGVKEFIFPKENKRDFEKIMDKFKDKDVIKGIKFHCVETIDEVLELILDK
jgi:ATP-dependent Lon protease